MQCLILKSPDTFAFALYTMSFKWKWIVTTFLTQIFFGLIFTGIQFQHMTAAAIEAMHGNVATMQLELGNLLSKSKSKREDVIRQYLQAVMLKQDLVYAALLSSSGKPMVTLGEFTEPRPSSLVSSSLVNSFATPGGGERIELEFDSDDVFGERDHFIIFLVGSFALSAFACSLVLLGLGNALTARLTELRLKAGAIQSGDTSVRIDVKGKDELSCLGWAFNNMAEAIELQISLMEENTLRSIAEKNRLDLLLSSLNSGVAYLDEQFNVQYVNKALARMLKTTSPAPSSPDLAVLLKRAGVVREQQVILNDLMTEYFRNHEAPVELDFTDGQALQFRFAIYRDKVQGPHGVLIVEDVSMRKNVEDLKNEVETDPLTAVLNRRGFEMTLQSRLGRLLPGELLGVMYLDLDGFKAVNDTLGHKAGDQILKTSASLLKGATRNIDLVARLGGDEFAIIIGRANMQLMKNISERIIDAFSRDKLLGRIRQNHHLSVTCSIGAALYPLHAKNFTDLLELSDRQMYFAKRAGKNCYRIASSSTNTGDEMTRV